MPGVGVDGNDVLEVQGATDDAVRRARAGDGPTLVGAVSYRMAPHSSGRKTELRSPDEIEAWRARDPIERFQDDLVARHGVPRARCEALERQAAQEVDDAVRFALDSPRPEPGTERDDVYAPAEWLRPGRLS
jgi:TPP-dependent pyruvate/acetoin dehydrogenase alpha subunit